MQLSLQSMFLGSAHLATHAFLPGAQLAASQALSSRLHFLAHDSSASARVGRESAARTAIKTRLRIAILPLRLVERLDATHSRIRTISDTLATIKGGGPAPSDPDYQKCAKVELEDSTLAACDRAIAGETFSGRYLAWLFNNRGAFYANTKKYDRALKDYDKAIETDPALAMPHFNRGRIFELKKDLKRALDEYTRSIELDPNYLDAYLSRGGVLFTLKYKDQAMADYGKAVEVAPHSAAAYVGRGFMYKELEDYEAALADYSKAIELDPKSVTAYRYRAYLYYKLGRGGAARDDFNRILELDPDDKDAAKALKRMGPDLRQMRVQ